MSIVSSVISKDIDLGGQRLIEETHTDSEGVLHIVNRFAPVGYDVAADLAARAAEIADRLAAEELEQVLQQ